MPDAVVIGAGPNGLVAANLLADHGWDVVVLEANEEPGGAVRSGELTRPGFIHDLFSAFYPLGAVSPVMQGLELESHGLRWRRAPLALAHAFPDGRAAVLSTDVAETAASVDSFGRGDGVVWHELYEQWQRLGPAVVAALMDPFPPVRAALKVGGKLRTPTNLLEFIRFTMLPVRRFAQERLSGDGATMLLAGNTLHTDLSPEATLGAFYGWLLTMLGQDVGFPVPEGGAGRLTDALVSRLRSCGGEVRCGARVTEIVVRDGRAVAVRTDAGDEVDAPRGVLADVAAPPLFLDLVGPEHLPSRFLHALTTFHWDDATFKVDWALDGPIPWKAEEASRAGTVHIGGDLDHLTEVSAQLATSRIPARPFCLFGQMHVADPTRSPEGTGTAWAYTHVPRRPKGDAGEQLRGTWDADDTARFVERIEDEVEARAPGFRDRVVGRHVFTPPDLEAADANLVGGAVNGGTAHLHQQLVFRPVPGPGRATTPVKGLFLASASAHPGGGVHGACGANAARAALWAQRRRLRR